MRATFRTLLISSILFQCLGPGAESVFSEEVVVSISEDATSIGGKEFVLSPSVDQLVQLWGKPDRESNLANKVRIWDKRGVRSYTEPGASSADTLVFTMKKQDSKLAAKEVFSGKVKLPNGEITSSSTEADLKKFGFRQDATLAKFYRLSLLAASLFAEVDPKDGSLVSLSLEFGL